MKIIIALVLLATIAGVYAETLPCGNYTASFTMPQTHVIGDDKIKTYDGWISVHEYKTIYNDVSIPISEINVSGSPATLGFFKDRSGYQAVMTNYPIIVISTMNLTSTMRFLDTLRIRKKV
jgi:hypothetical protein